MTEPTFDPSEGPDSSGPVIRDRRRLDPETGKVREPGHSAGPAPDGPE